VFTNKKREGTDTFVCAFSLYVAETPKASIKDHEPQLPIIPFGIVAYGFVGQPFSKQLYVKQKLFCRERKGLGTRFALQRYAGLEGSGKAFVLFIPL